MIDDLSGHPDTGRHEAIRTDNLFLHRARARADPPRDGASISYPRLADGITLRTRRTGERKGQPMGS
jgi:hypothetical protein